MFDWFYRRRHRKQTAQKIYGSIVAQARQRAFYEDLGVADSLEGRFEILVIHLFLALAALPDEKGGEELRGDLIDLFTADMDATMRELGFSDMRVPKKMRELSAALTERLSAYRALFDADDPAALAALLADHVPASQDNPVHAEHLARYMFEAGANMAERTDDGDGRAHELFRHTPIAAPIRQP